MWRDYLFLVERLTPSQLYSLWTTKRAVHALRLKVARVQPKRACHFDRTIERESSIIMAVGLERGLRQCAG